ncbi:MAG: 50S ribosomal protein L23 [Candidatus Heimdallarchaeota archaeon]
MSEPETLIIKPMVSEKSFGMIEEENKLVFLVKRFATKSMVKQAIQDLYEVRVAKVNTVIMPNGLKKAYVRFHPDEDAMDLAAKLGIF